jgi:hypothetical protein
MTRQTLAPLIGAAAAALLLAACASGPIYGYGDRDYASASVDYDGYYDGGYGQFDDGYWGAGGVFYYRDAPGHPYQRDDAHHFRRDQADGFKPIHGHHNPAPKEGGHEGGDQHH